MWSNLAALTRYRGLIQSLVVRELKARYRGSVLGFFWSFVNPLLLLGASAAVVPVVLHLILRQRPRPLDPSRAPNAHPRLGRRRLLAIHLPIPLVLVHLSVRDPLAGHPVPLDSISRDHCSPASQTHPARSTGQDSCRQPVRLIVAGYPSTS